MVAFMRLLALLLIASAAIAQAPKWHPLVPSKATSAKGATVEVDAEGVVRVSGKNPEVDTIVIEGTTSLTELTGLRIEALPDPKLPAKGPGRARNGNFVLTHVKLETSSRLSPGRFRLARLGGAVSSFAQGSYPATAALNPSPRTGWAISPHFGKPHTMVVMPATPPRWKAQVHVRLTLSFAFGSQHVFGRFRVSATDGVDPVAGMKRLGESWGKTQLKVNKAIDRGVEWLMQKQYLDGSFVDYMAGYPTGCTALGLYTLLKSGVSKKHLAVRKAAAFLRVHRPAKTYSTACQLLAFVALGKAEDEELIGDLVAQLLQFQKSNGGWGYPGGAVDLSNTQYAALALHMASLKGHKVPRRAWIKLASCALRHLRETEKNAYAPAGFGYRPGTTATGSMTSAGIGTLAICDLQLRRKNNEVSVAIKRGIQWLGRYFSPSSNMFAPNQTWVYYYLYGLERAGGLTGEDRFGPHDWYRAGARWLVGKQATEGAWPVGASKTATNTCFALLFLSKATGSVTGGQASGARVFGYEDRKKPVSLRASGDSPLAMWISRFGDKALKENAWPGETGKGLHVEKVEYVASRRKDLKGAKVIQRVGRDPAAPHGKAALAAQHAFKQPGGWWLQARATVVKPGGAGAKVVLKSDPVRVVVWNVRNAEYEAYASDASRNLLRQTKVAATASSEFNNNWRSIQSVDGLAIRGWLAKDDDKKPKIRLLPEQPIRANALVLCHAQHGDAGRSRPTKVAVKINGRVPLGTVDMIMDNRRKTIFRFSGPKVIRSLELTIVETNNKARKGSGFGEIELQLIRDDR